MNFEAYKYQMTKLSTDELWEYINKSEAFLEDAVIAACKELKNRGLENESSISILKILEEKKIAEQKVKEEKVEELKQKIEELTDLPILYSRLNIWLFSVLFSPLFGGILMAINLFKTKHKTQAYLCIFFGFAYSLTVTLGSYYYNAINTLVPILLYALGAFILEEIFWRRIYGYNILYIKRQVLIPIIIALALNLLATYFAGNLGL